MILSQRIKSKRVTLTGHVRDNRLILTLYRENQGQEKLSD